MPPLSITTRPGVLRATLLVLATLLACACTRASDTLPKPDAGNPAAARDAAADSGAAVCEPGAPQTCNDDIRISSLHGTCRPDATCTCHPPYKKNPKTARCL